MSKKSEAVPRWSIAEARKHFSEVIRMAREAPQPIFNRDKLVAAVVDAAAFDDFRKWSEDSGQESIGEAFAQLRQLCMDEDYELEIPAREDRQNPLVD